MAGPGGDGKLPPVDHDPLNEGAVGKKRNQKLYTYKNLKKLLGKLKCQNESKWINSNQKKYLTKLFLD